MAFSDKKKYASLTITPLYGEKTYPSLEAEKMHELACAVIEQAVYDWIALDYGKRGYIVGRDGNSLVYRAEVKSFFQGAWCEFLLAYALPEFSPQALRKELQIEEPQKRRRV